MKLELKTLNILLERKLIFHQMEILVDFIIIELLIIKGCLIHFIVVTKLKFHTNIKCDDYSMGVLLLTY